MTSPPRARLGRRVAVLVVLAWSAAACGVPVDGAVRVVEREAVPTALVQPAGDGSPSAAAESRPAASGAAVAFTSGDRLTLVPRRGIPQQPEAAEQALLDTLVAGPTDAQRRAGLGTALPDSLGLRVVSVDTGLLTIEVTESNGGARSDDVPKAIAQIVLTATSLPTVEAVTLVRDGQPIPVPRADGVSTTSPLTADEFASMLDLPADS